MYSIGKIRNWSILILAACWWSVSDSSYTAEPSSGDLAQAMKEISSLKDELAKLRDVHALEKREADTKIVKLETENQVLKRELKIAEQIQSRQEATARDALATAKVSSEAMRTMEQRLAVLTHELSMMRMTIERVFPPKPGDRPHVTTPKEDPFAVPSKPKGAEKSRVSDSNDNPFGKPPVQIKHP